jgi:hypothetical protein
MPEPNSHDEVCQLTEELTALAIEGESGLVARIGVRYWRDWFVARGLLAGDSIVQPPAPAEVRAEIDKAEPHLEAVRIWLRGRLPTQLPKIPTAAGFPNQPAVRSKPIRRASVR